MSRLENALCVGQWWMFDSVNPDIHKQARELCHACPVLTDCGRLLRDELSSSIGIGRQGGGPTGTWAGQLVSKASRGRNGRANAREHGSDRGYYQHRYEGDAACDECREAHRLAERARKDAS